MLTNVTSQVNLVMVRFETGHYGLVFVLDLSGLVRNRLRRPMDWCGLVLT